MTIRLQLQRDGISNPSHSAKNATQDLVDNLSKVDQAEEVIVSIGVQSIRYILATTLEILGEIPATRDT